MDSLDPHKCTFGGCTLTRAIERMVRQAGFERERLDKLYMEGDLEPVGSVTRGVARRPD